MSTPDWDSVPDVTETGRSIVPYPDPHPEFMAGVWQRLRAARTKLHEVHEDEEPEVEVSQGYETPIVTQEAVEFDDPCGSLAGFVKLAHANGWTLVTLAHSISTSKGKAFAGGQKAGTFRPDRAVDQQWAHFEKENVGRVVISFPIVNGQTRGTDVVRSFNGIRYSDADMKKILKGSYEQDSSSD